MEEQKKIIISAVSVIAILALIWAGFYFASKNKKVEQEDRKNEEINVNTDSNQPVEEKSEKEIPVLGGVPEINAGVSEAVKNPAEEIPSANPYENVKNPFKDTYKNPFK